MFWCNVFGAKSDVVLATCDEELLDKEFGAKGVKVKIKKEFYGGKLVDGDTVVKLMKTATVGNLIGKEITELAEKNGFITKENIIFIDDIPHAQFVKL